MSILIKGMEMPKTCCHCPLMGYDSDREWFDGMARTGAYICALTGELIDNTKREEHCPLTEIPSHGDLIDRDALGVVSWKADEVEDTFDAGVLFALDRIDALPTIIEAEECE